jgi:hypothetical protein
MHFGHLDKMTLNNRIIITVIITRTEKAGHLATHTFTSQEATHTITSQEETQSNVQKKWVSRTISITAALNHVSF